MNSQGSQLGKTSQLGKGTQVGKGPSQKGSKLGNFKAPKQIHPQSSRASTPDTQPNGQSDLSRDELARTVSAHGNRRRKRADVFESEGEEADDSPLGSPKRAKTTISQKKSLPKASSQSIDSQKDRSLKPVATINRSSSSGPKPVAANGGKPTATKAARSAASNGIRENSIADILFDVVDNEEEEPMQQAPRVAFTPRGTTSRGHGDDIPPSRSRTASSSTLMARSQSNSQNQSSVYLDQTQGTQVQVSTPARKQTKAEDAAFAELLVLSRRYYLTFLSNNIVDEPVQLIFPGMKTSHPMYKKAVTKVRQCYKNWKVAVIAAAADFVNRWISTAKADKAAKLAALNSHKALRQELLAGFCIEWLEMVFRFAIPVVDFDDVHDEGMKFLKYAFVQIVTLQRLNEFHEKDVKDPRFTKYTRRYLLDMYDCLYKKTGFESQNVDLYPERVIPLPVQNRRSVKVDINNDSDGSWGDEEETQDENIDEDDNLDA